MGQDDRDTAFCPIHVKAYMMRQSITMQLVCLTCMILRAVGVGDQQEAARRRRRQAEAYKGE